MAYPLIVRTPEANYFLHNRFYLHNQSSAPRSPFACRAIATAKSRGDVREGLIETGRETGACFIRLIAPIPAKMVSTDAARSVVGIIGNVISFGLFMSPLPTFVEIYKKKAVEQFSPMPYLATLLNCMLWVFYGLPIVHPNSILVVTINAAGLVFEGIYLSIFFCYSTKKLRLKLMKILAGELAFMGVVVSVVLTVGHSHEKRSLMVGVLCVFFGTCMYASPLSVMKLVIKTKSVKYMPFWLSFVGFLNGVCWTSYALLKFDIFLTIPNGLGTLFGLVQLLLYACYCRCAPVDEAKVEEEDKQKEVEIA